jgi:nickel-dependent lactate racemase
LKFWGGGGSGWFRGGRNGLVELEVGDGGWAELGQEFGGDVGSAVEVAVENHGRVDEAERDTPPAEEEGENGPGKAFDGCAFAGADVLEGSVAAEGENDDRDDVLEDDDAGSAIDLVEDLLRGEIEELLSLHGGSAFGKRLGVYGGMLTQTENVMSLFFAVGSPEMEMTPGEYRAGLYEALGKLGKKKKVLAVPPDFTRFHSKAGELTEMAWDYYGAALTDVLPALGTHKGMTDEEIATMFGATPRELFRVHNWRDDIVTLGEVPSAFMLEVSEGKLDYTWPAQVNKLLRDGGHDLILSIGQVVPHEVVGMANGSKNIFVGTGGVMGIHRSHFLGAVYGMERMMGRADTPVRRVLNYASEHFAQGLPIVYVQTVVNKNAKGELVMRGLYIGDDGECFEKAAELSLQCNFLMMDREIHKAVVFLDPHEFRSTWLGNKSVYRTRMALADGAELIVLAPAVHEFGEDPAIDTLIRKYGYCGTPATLEYVKEDPALAANLSAAAHLIHGSSEGRFTIRYCPGHLTREEIESVHFEWGDLAEYTAKYDPAKLVDGWNVVEGEEIFYISNPGLGLWAYRGRFGE